MRAISGIERLRRRNAQGKGYEQSEQKGTGRGALWRQDSPRPKRPKVSNATRKVNWDTWLEACDSKAKRDDIPAR